MAPASFMERGELTEKIWCRQWAGQQEAPRQKPDQSGALPSRREISLYIPPILEATPFSRGAAISSMKMIIICRLNKIRDKTKGNFKDNNEAI